MRLPRNFAAKATVAPAAVAVFVAFYGSTLWTAYVSLTRSALLPNYEYAGFFQYTRLFASARWQTAYGNMFIFGALVILLALLAGTVLAVLIDNDIRFEGALRTILLYPLSLSFVVTGLAWQWVLSPSIGVQSLVRSLGWDDFVFDWLIRQDRVIYTLVFAAVWHQTGLIMTIMLAGLRGVDREIWRATRVEGISRFRAYVHVVLPMMRPLVITCVVLLAVAVVKSYDLVVAMTGGGPGFASDLPGKFVVDSVFERSNIGLASAASMVMLGTVLAALAPYFAVRLARRRPA